MSNSQKGTTTNAEIITEGLQKLEINITEFAKLIGVSRPSASYYINGRREPSREVRRKIENLLKVKLESEDRIAMRRRLRGVGFSIEDIEVLHSLIRDYKQKNDQAKAE